MPQQRMNKSPYFFRKRMIYCSVNDLIILSLRKKIATGRKRKDSPSFKTRFSLTCINDFGRCNFLCRNDPGRVIILALIPLLPSD